ncbi:semaphorin-like protein [Fowlpox virus]|nr:semaphorin-like protein [Fowlpox virus]
MRIIILLLTITSSLVISEDLLSPRIRTSITEYNESIKSFNFTTEQYDVVTYHVKGDPFLVGTVNKLHVFNFTDSKNTSIDFSPEKEDDGYSSNCESTDKNYITFIGSYQNKTTVCGTNACSPKCWFLVGYNNKTKGPSGLGLAPYKFNSSNDDIVLVDGDNIYSTIPKYQRLHKKFRRILGNDELYNSDSVLRNPTFIKIVALNESNPINDTIYVFLLEGGKSKVFRVCKGDKGATGSLSSSKWSTLLKSVLVCKDNNNRHFSKLIEVFVSQNSINTHFYGLFMNEWGFSAVCMFNFKNMQRIFNISPLKGFTGKIPNPRPGTCLTSSTPSDTFKVIDEYPEINMTMLGEMLFESRYPYTHLVVNTTKIHYKSKYYNVTVLYLSTDNGKIHKVVTYKDGSICVMEVSLKQYYSPVLSMNLDNFTNKLYVSYNDTIIQLPTALCSMYGKTCNECVMSRDPDCGWSENKSNGKCIYGNGTKILKYNVTGYENTCSSSKVQHKYLNRTIMLSPSSYHVLSCPTVSYQATYKWLKDNSTIKECVVGIDDCSYMISDINNKLGEYICTSEESWSSMVSMVDNLKLITR